MLTPCVKICVYNAQAQLCEGCGRTGEEIGGWLKFSTQEREKIMLIAPTRLDNFKNLCNSKP